MWITFMICLTVLAMFLVHDDRIRSKQNKELTEYFTLLEQMGELRTALKQIQSTHDQVTKQAQETHKLMIQTNLSSAFVPRRNREAKIG